jgi:hypothetical protein
MQVYGVTKLGPLNSSLSIYLLHNHTSVVSFCLIEYGLTVCTLLL